MNVAFFDRDGTIIEDYEDHEWTRVNKPVFMDGAIETLDYIQKQGYSVGMIEQALMNYPKIRLGQSFIVGDSKVDVDLATRLGVRGYGIRVTNEQPNVTLIHTISDLQSLINNNER